MWTLSRTSPIFPTSGFEFHQFQSLDRLSRVSEVELRKTGFGYRAKYITSTVNAWQSKPGGANEWLLSLRRLDLQDAVSVHHPVLVQRSLLPDLAGAKLTIKLWSRVT